MIGFPYHKCKLLLEITFFLVHSFIKLCLCLVKHKLVLSLFADQTVASFSLFIKSGDVIRKMEAFLI